ncbi:unnamed protein product [Amoebophrya sp. A120]|nr:unnamed protein product [Amoebophrya sp. A120]|eukprot:GSA120T00001195001.1
MEIRLDAVLQAVIDKRESKRIGTTGSQSALQGGNRDGAAVPATQEVGVMTEALPEVKNQGAGWDESPPQGGRQVLEREEPSSRTVRGLFGKIKSAVAAKFGSLRGSWGRGPATPKDVVSLLAILAALAVMQRTFPASTTRFEAPREDHVGTQEAASLFQYCLEDGTPAATHCARPSSAQTCCSFSGDDLALQQVANSTTTDVSPRCEEPGTWARLVELVSEEVRRNERDEGTESAITSGVFRYNLSPCEVRVQDKLYVKEAEFCSPQGDRLIVSCPSPGHGAFACVQRLREVDHEEATWQEDKKLSSNCSPDEMNVLERRLSRLSISRPKTCSADGKLHADAQPKNSEQEMHVLEMFREVVEDIYHSYIEPWASGAELSFSAQERGVHMTLAPRTRRDARSRTVTGRKKAARAKQSGGRTTAKQPKSARSSKRGSTVKSKKKSKGDTMRMER